MASEEPSTSTGVTKAKKRKPAKPDWTWEDEMLMYDVVHRDKVTQFMTATTFPISNDLYFLSRSRSSARPTRTRARNG